MHPKVHFMLRILLQIPIAAGIAFFLDFLIAQAGFRLTPVPKSFPPFTVLPILSGAVGGPVLAALAYAVIRPMTKQPEKVFLFVAIITLALSFALPLRLSFTRSPRFAGVTPTAQMILVLMHTVVATVSVAALLARPDR